MMLLTWPMESALIVKNGVFFTPLIIENGIPVDSSRSHTLL